MIEIGIENGESYMNKSFLENTNNNFHDCDNGSMNIFLI